MDRVPQNCRPLGPRSNGRPRILPVLACLSVITCVVLLASAVAWAGAPTKNLLVIHSYNQGYPWTDDVTEGIRTGLQRSGQPVQVSIEYLDLKAHSLAQLAPELVSLFHAKYDKVRFDAIIVADNDGLTFVLHNRKSIFHNAPIVFCGINDFQDSMIQGHADVTGLVEALDVKGTILAALRVVPGAKRVVAVSDLTTTGKANVRLLRSAVAQVRRLRPDVQFSELVGLPAETLVSRLQQLPKDSVVMLFTFSEDRDGRLFAFDDSLKLVTSNTSVPTFAFWQHYLGKGIVGGVVVSGTVQGETAANMALRIMSGTPAGDIPIVRVSPNVPMFDYKTLVGFGIRESMLPMGSVVINHPEPFYERYRLMLLVTAFLSVVVVALLTNWGLRRRMMLALRRSEARFHTLFDHSGDAILIHDIRGIVVDVNERATQMYGFSVDEFRGKGLSEIVAAPYRGLIAERISEVTKRGQMIMETAHVRKDGSVMPIEVNAQVISFGGRVLMLSTARDITDRKRAEQEKKQFYRETISSVTDGKLQVVGTREIEDYRAQASYEADMSSAVDISSVRLQVQDFCSKQGFEGDELSLFITGLGEAMANAIKHAGGGSVFAGASGADVWAGVSDSGPGIATLALPKATLRRGYSTRVSMGMGYSIMLDVSDRIMLSTGPEGTTVVLCRTIGDIEPAISLGNLPDTWDSIDG